jgi:hypothetical protein
VTAVLDLTVTLGNIIEIGVIIAGGIAVLLKTSTNVSLLNAGLIAVKDDMVRMQTEIKEMAAVITQLSVQTVRMDALSERIAMLDRRYEELRRGNGWVTGRHTLDGEYP